jgi:transposase
MQVLKKLEDLNGMVVTEGGIKTRKRKKFLNYEDIKQIHQILDQRGPKGQADLAKQFDVSPGTMGRVIKEWHERGAPVANKGGGMAAAIKQELMDKLSRCKNVSDMRAALRDCLSFLE